jgi:hypothetical protein
MAVTRRCTSGSAVRLSLAKIELTCFSTEVAGEETEPSGHGGMDHRDQCPE